MLSQGLSGEPCTPGQRERVRSATASSSLLDQTCAPRARLAEPARGDAPDAGDRRLRQRLVGRAVGGERARRRAPARGRRGSSPARGRAAPAPRRSPRRARATCASSASWCARSSAASGSSARIHRGSPASTRASKARARSPPESVETGGRRGVRSSAASAAATCARPRSPCGRRPSAASAATETVPGDLADLRQVADPPRPLAAVWQRRARKRPRRVGLEQPGKALQQRRLARADWAADRGDPARFERPR
jgi:hypothetical protein